MTEFQIDSNWLTIASFTLSWGYMKVKFDSVFDSILHGDFPTNTRANNINARVVSNDMKRKLVSLNKSKMVWEKVLVVKSVHNSEDSLRKVTEMQINFMNSFA